MKFYPSKLGGTRGKGWWGRELDSLVTLECIYSPPSLPGKFGLNAGGFRGVLGGVSSPPALLVLKTPIFLFSFKRQKVQIKKGGGEGRVAVAVFLGCSGFFQHL